MSSPAITITDKVVRMIKSMVHLAMRVYYRRGATAAELSSFLDNWTPSNSQLYHEGVVEAVLFDLHSEGKVIQAGARWYPVGLAR